MVTKKRQKGKKPPAEAAMRPLACRRIREALGLTQVEFGSQLGVQPLTIILWETGKTPISKGRAIAIQSLKARGVA